MAMQFGYPSYNPQPVGYYNPSQQIQMPQFSQMQQNISNVKIVDSIEMVKFTDIPMDGNSYYFPKADGTEIYSKRWLSNGSTEISVYKKFIPDSEQETEHKFDFGLMETNIMDKLNVLDEKLSKINPKPIAKGKEVQ